MGNAHDMKTTNYNESTFGGTSPNNVVTSHTRPPHVPPLHLDGVTGTSAGRVSPDNQELPAFNRLSLRHSDQNDVRMPMGIEIETSKLDTTRSTTSSVRRSQRYILRYRNEEEKLTHILSEKETKLKLALEQGQKLRAKCNRYKDELESLRDNANESLTDSQWKKKYSDLDKIYRALKEETDILKARNRNGRDYLRQQEETIQQLNIELQQERMEKEDFMSNSLLSLQNMGTRGKKASKQFAIDNKLLHERVVELTERNQRGREYLAKFEAEKLQSDSQIMMLNEQLQEERYETETLTKRLSSLAGAKALANNTDVVQLDDVNRPLRLAEQYWELFDNQWRDAFTELTGLHDMTEETAVTRLLDVLTTIYTRCRSIASDQLATLQEALKPCFGDNNNIQEHMRPFIRQRQANYSEYLPKVIEAVESALERLRPALGPTSCLEAYISRATEICWLLAIQNPPCALEWEVVHGDYLDHTKLKTYTRVGTEIEYMVWPVLYLHHNGPLLNKGVAQPVKTATSDIQTTVGQDGVSLYAQVQKDRGVTGHEKNQTAQTHVNHEGKVISSSSGPSKYESQSTGFDAESSEVSAAGGVHLQHYTYVRDGGSGSGQDAMDGYAVVNELNQLHSDHQIIQDGDMTVIITSVDNSPPTPIVGHSPNVSQRGSPIPSRLIIRVGDDNTTNKYNLDLDAEECMTRF